MIRHRRGDEFLLITQHDHAQLAGEFARHLGNGNFEPPSPLQPTIDGAALHDCGWPLHDDRPTLNERGEPLHVLESPMKIATQVWGESARRAAEHDPYAGLLVSLHVLGLSFIAMRDDDQPHERARDASEVFELNKFQHRQVELQESLRRRLGMRTDVPLKQGLAAAGTDAGEDLLRFNFGYLRAMDALALDVCCSEDLFPSIAGVHPRPGAPAVTLTVGHPRAATLTVDPWPFDVDRLASDMPCRRVPAVTYASAEAFFEVYEHAPRESLAITIAPA